MISKSEILERPYWNDRLIKKLLPEPNEIIRHTNGHVRKYQYIIERVEEAETTGIFQERVSNVDSYDEHKKENIETLKAGLEKATEMDFRGLVIPSDGGFLEVYEACEKQFQMRKAILRNTQYTYDTSICGYHWSYADPCAEICRRIAKVRPDLAFEAGIQYLNKFYGVGNISEVLSELESVDAEEAKIGEPVYILRTW